MTAVCRFIDEVVMLQYGTDTGTPYLFTSPVRYHQALDDTADSGRSDPSLSRHPVGFAYAA